MLADLIAWITGGVAQAAVDPMAWRQRAAVAAESGQVLGAFRVRQGTVSGLGRHWREVEARLNGHRLAFERQRLPLDDLRRMARPRARDAFGLMVPDPVLVEIRSGDAVVEWALPETDADGILDPWQAGR
ncbi:MAG: hypothetical protein P0Y48_08600 [Candidatus Microbacterium phytovorans]|uniref:Uncharacterized protein n=1 Tax=Candidatus Microbacterium phytovorans TaxID=3121374 RepID=A0AAJ5VY54_9MICO|nr:hypothetical protein [Microbacterium sp.]WEK12536.1 MAG: hypothetical protein P0Y48_08600 [Microbacterium sp.]